MGINLANVISSVAKEKGISEELVVRTVQETLLAAYKRKYGTFDNAVFEYDELSGEVSIRARKRIVEEVDDEALEVSLDDARLLAQDAELGDEILIDIDPRDFDRGAIQSAKQKTRQSLREIQKDAHYAEYKDKEGEIIIGYYQRDVRGNIILDLGGGVEGFLPKRFQSPRESYRTGDRIKAMIVEVSNSNGLQIVLSRTNTDFVRRIFELEVPEIYDRTVEIIKIVREAGYRTKIAVYSHRNDVDPVGACVGLKGVRIQAIVRELEGERVDILKFDTDPKTFIRNALSPAEIDRVIILDEHRHHALAVVDDSQLSLAIGKQGQNVRLANRLVDWNIDVKTKEQFSEMDIQVEKRMAVKELFSNMDEDEEISRVSELPGVSADIVEVLEKHGITEISDLVRLSHDELSSLPGLGKKDVKLLEQIIAENVTVSTELDKDESLGTNNKDEYYEANSENGDTHVYQADQTQGVTDETVQESEDDDEEISLISELPDIPQHIVKSLSARGISDIVDLLNMSAPQIRRIEGLSSNDVDVLLRIIEENVEIIEEDEDEDEEE